jgi:hypothetical protein
MGAAGNPVYISETRNLYQYRLSLLPMEDTDCFDLIQDRGQIIMKENITRVAVYRDLNYA